MAGNKYRKLKYVTRCQKKTTFMKGTGYYSPTKINMKLLIVEDNEKAFTPQFSVSWFSSFA